MPGRSRSSALGTLARRRRLREVASIAAVDLRDAPGKASLGERRVGHDKLLTDAQPGGIQLGQLERHLQRAPVVQCRDGGVCLDPIAWLDRSQTDDTRERRQYHPIGQVLARLAQHDLGQLHATVRLVDDAALDGSGAAGGFVARHQAPGRLETRRRQVDGQPLRTVLQAQQHLSRLDPLAGTEFDRRHLAGRCRKNRHRACGQPASQHLEPGRVGHRDAGREHHWNRRRRRARHRVCD